MKFIDLFAGLGGFHVALKELGHKCVFACEINSTLRELYQQNHRMCCEGDINSVDVKMIPDHDILCAGFPCQPFSKAGKRHGLSDRENGNFFNRILEIIQLKRPEYIILENVAHLLSHDNGKTWDYIYSSLSRFYDVDHHVTSPHKFGIPQNRFRIYIVGRLKRKGGLSHFEFPVGNVTKGWTINSIIDANAKDITPLKNITVQHLKTWQVFLDHLAYDEAPSFPIWAMEFGATYPFEGKAPVRYRHTTLKKFKGTFGNPILGNSKQEVLSYLPTYARLDQDEFPDWKKYFIQCNREFYSKHKKWLKDWLPSIHHFENSHQKLEWNCGTKGPLKIKNKIVQFRPSGIRIKQPTFSPALVKNTTQIPIFPWLNRYMTAREAAKLQCLETLKQLPDSNSAAFEALGNAVNVKIVKEIAKNLISY